MQKNVVHLDGINKSFSGVEVLKGASFELRRGEVHALLGENGAGKTTLMRVLAGELTPDDGKVLIGNQEVHFTGPEDAKQHGISLVHQELALLPSLSIAENLFLGRLPLKRGIVDWKRLNRESRKILSKLDVHFAPETYLKELSIGERQIVEIARAISLDAEVFIMDEPTASLSAEESTRLFQLMEKLVQQGKSIIYISHRLQEVLSVTHRITVLRDGQTITTVPSSEVSPDDLTELIIGRKLEENNHASIIRPDTEVVLEVRNIKANKVNGVHLQVHKGEIVGIYGLIGAGRTELARAILGIDPRQSGEVLVHGKAVPGDIRSAIRRGIGFLPEDRKAQALFQQLPVYQNVTIVSLDKVSKNGLIRENVEKHVVKRFMDELKVKAFYNSLVRNLSGGTQQKIGLSKWLHANSQVLILDEPTKGIDIAARFEIYETLYELARQGVAILVISSDPQEILRVSHRTLIMRQGQIVGELGSEQITEEVLLAYALGSSKAIV